MARAIYSYIRGVVLLLMSVSAAGWGVCYAAEPATSRRVEAEYPGEYRLIWYYAPDSPSEDHLFKAQVQDKQFFIDPGVKPPTINSVFLLEHGTVNEGDEVLDMGTGAGLHAIFAADKAQRVVAVDIEAAAIANAKTNAAHNGVADKIDFRIGNLFAPLAADEKFDVIFLNVAYPFDAYTLHRWNLHERFFAAVREHMKPGGRIYYQIGFLWNIPRVLEMTRRNGLRIMRMKMVNAPRYKREPLFFVIQVNGAR